MAFRDLREFVAALEANDEIRTISGADWDLEVGTLTELFHERRGPALMFDEIKGYAKGHRILCNPMLTFKRALIALGFPPTLDPDGALVRFDELISSFKPVPPVEVGTAPFLENTRTGADVDLWSFPAPKWHEADGGRYLGTGCLVALRDPDTGVTNYGAYRVMIHDRATAGLYISPSHTGAIIRNKYWARGQACPVAVVLGQEPVTFLVGTPMLGEKRGVDKLAMAGHLRGEPVEVFCEATTGLPVPASGEIVIAGEVPPPDVEVRDEGPFGEWTGYYASGTRAEPVIRVRATYHRNDPIVLGMPPVRYRHGVKDLGIPAEARSLKQKLARAGIEDVLDVWQLTIPGVIVIQIRQRYPGHAMKAALTLAGEYMGRFVVVVDEDIDPRNADEVLWAIGTRCDPATTISIVNGCQSSVLDPRIPPERKRRGDLTSSQAIINACKPYDWIGEFPATNVASPALRAATLEKWRRLFTP